MEKIIYIKIFKALSDETRLNILQEIAIHEEICVCKLMEKFTVKSKGKWNFYSINMETLQNVLSENMIKTLFDK